MDDLPALAFGSFRPNHGGATFPGVCIGRNVWPLSSIPDLETIDGPDLLGLFERWDQCQPFLEAFYQSGIALSGHGSTPLSELATCLPVTPRQIVCVGANYRRHVIEMMAAHDVGSELGLSSEERLRRATRIMDHRAAHGRPFAFIKPASALLAPGEDLIVPPDSEEIDWELELAVVIGKRCHRVSRDYALDHVAGYAIANDISARDRLSRRDIPGIGLDLVAGKAGPGFFPLGPYVVPASAVGDPQRLAIELRLNGEVMQNDTTADMVFPVAALIEFISTYMVLLPGDVISTGSPAGNGAQYNRYIQPGDIVEGRIERLGLQTFACVAEEIAPGASMHRPFVAMTDEFVQ